MIDNYINLAKELMREAGYWKTDYDLSENTDAQTGETSYSFSPHYLPQKMGGVTIGIGKTMVDAVRDFISRIEAEIYKKDKAELFVINDEVKV